MPTTGSALSATSSPPGIGAAILLVEDELAVLRVTERILTQLGYHVLHAARGEDALDIARNDETVIDLLLTDVLMPDMNGIELAQSVQALRPNIRVLFMSGFTADSLGAQQDGQPPVLLLQKPFTRETLVGAIQLALASS
jgi:CheY-like chemotaxis protein